MKKSEFITYLNCHAGNSDGEWILSQPLFYYSELLDTVIKVPTGFTTDFASVARLPIIFMFFGNRAHHESVVHDYLYRVDSKPVVKRKVADRVFLEAMQLRGKPMRIRWPMYCGVRTGGFPFYHRKPVWP